MESLRDGWQGSISFHGWWLKGCLTYNNSLSGTFVFFVCVNLPIKTFFGRLSFAVICTLDQGQESVLEGQGRDSEHRIGRNKIFQGFFQEMQVLHFLEEALLTLNHLLISSSGSDTERG